MWEAGMRRARRLERSLREMTKAGPNSCDRQETVRHVFEPGLNFAVRLRPRVK